MATDPNPVAFPHHHHHNHHHHQNISEKGSAMLGNQSTPTHAQVQITPRALSPCFTNILPSNQAAVSGISSSGNSVRTPGTSISSTEKLLVADAAPGPLRLPKPLTAVDLYAQLEREQEAVVNRLTRELSLLRTAQNASVVSSVSSTSISGLHENNEYNISSLLSGHSHPTPYFNRHRSSSTVSNRSMTAGNPSSLMSCMATDRGIGRAGLTRRESNTAMSQTSVGGKSTSRRNSASKFNQRGQNQSGASSPIAVPLNTSNYSHHHTPELWSSLSSSYSSRPVPPRDSAPRSQSIISSVGEKEVQMSNRFEDIAVHRNELENARKENEILRLRVRELEALVKKKQAAATGEAKLSENEKVNNV